MLIFYHALMPNLNIYMMPWLPTVQKIMTIQHSILGEGREHIGP